ncbi:MAG: hypothetical protein LBJ44_07590 [Propionibacteriaceae bacterium]|jgi:phosphoglycerate dehydrogenase-like enzyme|nr:hypothetical protein [Propionibacteriaceae bacterium]
MERRPRIGIVVTEPGRRRYFADRTVQRLSAWADLDWLIRPGTARQPGVPDDARSQAELARFAADLDALIVSYGSPRVDATVLAGAPRLRFIGDTHGDRSAARVDLAAAAAHGVVVSDTTNGSSDPVAEWALALTLIGLRNAGAHFRRLVAGELLWPDRDVLLRDPGYLNGELTGKTVGLIALGNVGRRLVELLAPFQVKLLAYDPGAPDVLADVLDLDLTSLERVLAGSDVVVCLVPLTRASRGLIGADQLALLRPGTVFVNVSRGAVVDTEALIARLEVGDLIGCLDVVEPEPLAVDSPLRQMPNVFLSPHIAGVTDAAEFRFFELMADEVARVLSGCRPRYRLTPRESNLDPPTGDNRLVR